MSIARLNEGLIVERKKKEMGKKMENKISSSLPLLIVPSVRITEEEKNSMSNGRKIDSIVCFNKSR